MAYNLVTSKMFAAMVSRFNGVIFGELNLATAGLTVLDTSQLPRKTTSATTGMAFDSSNKNSYQ